METQSVSLRVVFENRSVLSQTQRADGMNQSWLLIEPQHHPKISDVCDHLLHVFNLRRSCPNGILLYMKGFVLPPSESTRILKDKEILCVKRKEMALAQGMEKKLEDKLLPIETVSKKRKAFIELRSPKSEHLQENEGASTAPDGAKKVSSKSARRKRKQWARKQAKISQKHDTYMEPQVSKAENKEADGHSHGLLSQEYQENVMDLETNGRWWDHFNLFVKKGENISSCKYCGKKNYSGIETYDTSALLDHLSQCPLYPENKDLAFQSGELDGRKVMEWKFDQQVIRKALMQMIIMDELPFKFVEGNGFKQYMSVTQPLFHIPSRFLIAEDCYQMFIDEKKKIRALLNGNIGRICLTTNTWTSIQNLNYMCLTAHFIDNDWNLRKKVINFCPISSHRGKDIGEAIEMCLFGWGIDNVLTITTDNTSGSDAALEYLKSKFKNWGKCVVKAKWTHVRCVAHILDSIIQDGLGHIKKSVDCVRGAVKYICESPYRSDRFQKYAEIEKCESTKSLALDVPTNWISTYLMLETAQLYEKAFYRYDCKERRFKEDLEKIGVPTSLDWTNVRKMVGFLKHFYNPTMKVCDTCHATSHTFLDDITSIFVVLKKRLNEVDDMDLHDIAKLTKDKFDKYYGDIKKLNMLVYVASVLDPRNKYQYLEVLLSEVYGKVDGESILNIVKDSINELFEDYVRIHSSPNLAFGKQSTSDDIVPERLIKENLRMKMKMKMGSCGVRESKSELEKYLSEEVEEDYPKFDILNWWRVNGQRFPILSLVARDVLAVPISSVGSELGFSTNERLLDSFRSSLTSEMVECLVCSQDWLRESSFPMDIEESWEKLKAIEEDLDKYGRGLGTKHLIVQ